MDEFKDFLLGLAFFIFVIAGIAWILKRVIREGIESARKPPDRPR